MEGLNSLLLDEDAGSPFGSLSTNTALGSQSSCMYKQRTVSKTTHHGEDRFVEDT